MTGSERIKQIVKWSGLKTTPFAKKIGYESGQSIFDLYSGKAKINAKVAVKIITIYPEISLNWILTGEGSMLKNKPDNVVANEQLETYEPKNENDMMLLKENEFLKKQLEEKDKQISKLLNLLSLTTSENEGDNKEEVA